MHQNKKISYANKSFLHFFEFSSLEEFLLQNDCICNFFLEDTLAFYPKENFSDWFVEIQSLPSDNRIIAMKRRGVVHYFNVSISKSESSFIKVTLRDSTTNFLQLRKLESKAYHDPLTGAFNRQYFYDFVLENVGYLDASLGVIMIDIDHFKNVNDTYGHDRGDILLQESVRVLEASTRTGDVLIRWGGEEFLLVLHVANLQTLRTIGENLRFAIAQKEYEEVGHLSISLGGAFRTQGAEAIESMITRADRALYRAKKEGRNRFCLDELA